MIATQSEPWILLPLVYGLGAHDNFTDYDHGLATSAIEDFVSTLPGNQEALDSELRAFATALYKRASPLGTRYYLDKTPRYHLIVDDIVRIFPDAKFIFLWRNPLAVAASMVHTWCAGRWQLYRFKVDLYRGIDKLLSTHHSLGSRAVSIRYEDLVCEPDSTVARILDYLGLDSDIDLLEAFPRTVLTGRMGDPTAGRYGSISRESLDNWREVYSSTYRKLWAARFLRRFEHGSLEAIGYNRQRLIEDVLSIRGNFLPSPVDLLYDIYGMAFHLLEVRQVRSKMRSWRSPFAHR